MDSTRSEPLPNTAHDDNQTPWPRRRRRRNCAPGMFHRNREPLLLQMALIISALAYSYAITLSSAQAAPALPQPTTDDQNQSSQLPTNGGNTMPHLLSPAQLFSLSATTTRTSARPVITDEDINSHNQLYNNDDPLRSSSSASSAFDLIHHPPVIHSNSMLPIFGVVPRLPLKNKQNFVAPSSAAHELVTNATASAELLLRMLANSKINTRALKQKRQEDAATTTTTTAMPPVPIVMTGSETSADTDANFSNDSAQFLSSSPKTTTSPPSSLVTTTSMPPRVDASLSDRSSSLPAELQYAASPHTEAVHIADLIQQDTTTPLVPLPTNLTNNSMMSTAQHSQAESGSVPSYILSSDSQPIIAPAQKALEQNTTINPNNREAKAISDLYAADMLEQPDTNTTKSALERLDPLLVKPTQLQSNFSAASATTAVLPVVTTNDRLSTARPTQEKMPDRSSRSASQPQPKSVLLLMNSNVSSSATLQPGSGEHAALLQAVRNNTLLLSQPTSSPPIPIRQRSSKLGAGALAGIIVGSCVGGIILLALLALLVVYFWRKRRRTKTSSGSSSTGTPSGGASSASSSASSSAAQQQQQYDPYGSALARHYYWANAEDKALTTNIYNSGGRGSGVGFGASSSSGIMGYAQHLDKASQRGSPVALTDFHNEMIFLDNDAFLDSLEDIGTTTLDRETLRRSIIDDDHKNTKV